MVEKIKLLCEKNGTTIKALEKELGLGNGSIRRWDDTAPSVDKVLLVAKRFGVTVEWLKGESDKKAPAPKGERASDDDIRFALFDGYDNITDEMYEEVKRFARMVRLREEAEREKEK